MQLLYKHVADLVAGANRILLLTDERIDGDTIGSTLGMFHVLQEMGKDVTVYSPYPLATTLAFLPGTEAIVRDRSALNDDLFDLAMVFDCADGVHVAASFAGLMKRIPLVVFDHHATNPRYGTVNVIEPEAASSADVTYRFVQQVGYKVNRDAAQCFLTGVITDTNAFQTANTTPVSIDVARELIGYGAKMPIIVEETLVSRPVALLRLWGRAFERLHHNDEFNALMTVVLREDLDACGLTDEEVDASAITELLSAQIEGQDMVIVMRETKDGGVKASLRAKDADVSKIAQRFGGGGHEKAAGFYVENARLREQNGKWSIARSS